MKFIPPVSRVDRGRYHYYVDGDQRRIPGVTTILSGGIPKPALINWAANSTAEGAVNDWDNLSLLGPAARLKALQGIRYETTNQAKNRGTEIHKYAERLVQGEEVTGIPDELRPYTEAYVRFIDAWQLDPVLVEVVIVSYKFGYAGTLDLIAEVTNPVTRERETALLDIKTGDRGVYSEAALQLAAYRFSDGYLDDAGDEQPMISVDATAVIHVTADEAVYVPTLSEVDQLTIFRHAKKIYEYQQDSDGLILPAVMPAKTSAARIVWGDE